MFQNLARQHSEFLDFNYTTFFDKNEQVNANHVDEILCRGVRELESDAFEPANLDIFRTTLSLRCANAFIRTFPSTLAEPLDFQKSKVYQFIGAALDCSECAYKVGELEYRIEKLSSEVISRFDPRGLVLVLRGSDRRVTINKILNSCGLGTRRPRPNTPERAGRTLPNRALAKKRGKLWEEFKRAGGTVKDLSEWLGGMDRSQISHYRTGRLPDTSQPARRIEDEIQKRLRSHSVTSNHPPSLK